MSNEILIPVRRRHAATRAQLETMVTYPQHWGYAEDEELTLTRLISGARRYSSRSALCRPQTMFDPVVNVDTHDCVGINTLTQLNNVGSAAGDFYVDAGTTGLHIKSRQTTYGDTAFLILEGYGEGANGHSDGYNGTKLIMCSSLTAANNKMFLIGSGSSLMHFDSLNDDKTVKKGNILVLEGQDSYVGIGTEPYCTLDIYNIGTVKSVLDLIKIGNDIKSADMIGTGSGIKFELYAFGSNDIVQAGRVSVYCEQNMNATASTRDTTMAFATCENNVLTDKLLINSAGQTCFSLGNAALPSITQIGWYDTGIYFPSTQSIAISTAGILRVEFDVAGNAQFLTNSSYLYFGNGSDVVSLQHLPSLGLQLIGGNASNGGILSLATNSDNIGNGGILGRINFSAPLEASGGNSILPGASLVAIVEDTFSATVNKTSLVFQTGISEIASTKMILNSAGNLGIGAAVVFDASAVGCLALANATAPSAHTDNQIYVYSADSLNTKATLALYTEEPVLHLPASCSDTLEVLINGTYYGLMLATVT